MTSRTLYMVVCAVAVFYFLLVVAFFSVDPDGPLIQAMRYTLPLFVAIPAAFLVEAFRRRSAFQEAIIELYYQIVDDLQKAIQYTKKDAPTEEEYFATLSDLSRSIDRIRAHFRNIEAPGKDGGYYPFEGVKTFYEWIENLGAGEHWKGRDVADQTRAAILHLWKFKVRDPLLSELDRHKPTQFMSRHAGEEVWHLPSQEYYQTRATQKVGD